MKEDKNQKLAKLEKFIKSFSRVAVAFSGGVDSSLLLSICAMVLPGNVLAITVISEFQSEDEIERAKEFAKKLQVPHRLVPVNVLNHKKISNNPPDRCYHCKKELLTTMLNMAGQEGYQVVVDGTNADDAKDYRPGLMALEELKVVSPFLRFGITKEWIRETSKKWGLSSWNLPPNACLATRVSYYTPLTTDLLKRIEKGERVLKNLGFSNMRLRVYDRLACIEINQSEMGNFFNKRSMVLEKIKALGFPVVALDLEGYVRGKLNRVINKLNDKS